MLDVNTVSKYDKNFISLVREIQHFSSSISPADRHYENYTRRLNFTDSIAISTYRNKNTLIGFSTVLHLPVYGNGVRILNRFYKDPEFRKKSLQLTDETKIMIDQQLSIAKSFNFDFAFMSRESNTNQFAMKHFVKQLMIIGMLCLISIKCHLIMNNSLLYILLRIHGKHLCC